MGSQSRILVDAFVADFNRSAKLYEMYQAPFSELVSRHLAKLANLSLGQDVLDVGTGTGSAALVAARLVGDAGSVVGIDVARGMLAIAERKASEEGLMNARFREMDARSLEFADGSFDAVISNLGIPSFCFDDTISESLRVLRTGGTLCFAEATKPSPHFSLFSRSLSKYKVKAAPPGVAVRRNARKLLQEQSERFPLSAYSRILKRTGFVSVRTLLRDFTTTQSRPEGLLRYYVTRERLEYGAMPAKSKRAFDAAILRDLEAICERNQGRFKRPVKFWVAEKSR